MYARYSSDNQRDESVEAQIRAMTKYCQDNEIAIVGEYIDRARSATTDDRPEFQKMIADSKQGTFNIVLVHKSDRFSRNRRDSLNYKSILKCNNVTVVSVLENFDDSPESVIMESLIEGMAEYYSKNLAREVMKGLNENALKCKSNGGRPSFGFKVNKETQTYEIVEEEARAVRFMFESISQGKSYDYIIKELDRQGFRTRDGNPFGKNLIHEMLKNEKYRGVYIYNRRASKDAMGRYNSRASKFDDEIVRIEGGMPRIIDDELWNNVNKLIVSRRRLKDYGGRKIRAYLLTGKIFCGNCGSTYCGSTRYAGKNHARYSSYSCSKKSNHSGLDCKTKEIRMEYIEDYVLREILRVVLADDRIPALVKSYQDAYAQRKSGVTDELKAIRTAIKVCEQKIANIIQVISTTGSSTLVNALEGLETEKAKLESELIAAESNLRSSVLTEEEVKAAYIKARELFLQGDYETKRQLINLYLNKVLVYDDYVEVYINALPDYIRQKLIKKYRSEGVYALTAEISGRGDGT